MDLKYTSETGLRISSASQRWICVFQLYLGDGSANHGWISETDLCISSASQRCLRISSASQRRICVSQVYLRDGSAYLKCISDGSVDLKCISETDPHLNSECLALEAGALATRPPWFPHSAAQTVLGCVWPLINPHDWLWWWWWWQWW